MVEFVNVPFRDSTETVQTKVDMFFQAIVTMRMLLASEKMLQTLGFFVMVLMLIRVINTTAVHPRIGVLIGTVKAGLDDIWHYAILFLLVFCFASMVATWSFGTRAEFEDLETSMQTQFNMLLGNLPPKYDEDPLLIIYISLSIVVQFFLMLNFLLAIIIENYMKVRQHIEDVQTEREFTYDVLVTIRHGTLGIFNNWPNRRRLGKLLQTRCSRRNCSWIELFVLGIPRKTAIQMIQTYRGMDALPAIPADERHTDMDRLGVLEERTLEHVSALEESVNLKFDAIMRILQAAHPHLANPTSQPPSGSSPLPTNGAKKLLPPAAAKDHAKPDAHKKKKGGTTTESVTRDIQLTISDVSRSNGRSEGAEDGRQPAATRPGLPHAHTEREAGPEGKDWPSAPPLVNSNATTPKVTPIAHAPQKSARSNAAPTSPKRMAPAQARKGSGENDPDSVDPSWVVKVPSTPQNMSGSEEGAGRSISGSFCFGEFKDGGQSPELSAQQDRLAPPQLPGVLGDEKTVHVI